MSANEDNKWRRRQSTQGNSASPSPNSSQNFNQPRRSDSRSDRSSTSFQQQNNRSYSNNSNNSAGFSGMVDEHTSVNGFNVKEVRDQLNKTHNEALTASQASGDNKPIVYKNSDKGWTTPQSKSSPWGMNKHAMAGGSDFLSRLRKGVQTNSTNGGGKDGKFGG
ncbi:hypothetical protein H072_5268 [Dactylellina haptotyla CBS 200.50]|uniref:Uncharacterized protein n=1 Tax=Dactylellina haptotyla (strain CBS 200.50) TaxID=1284197 RepID=S8BN54_DACHA|nr:hypothetical protein H072_5268 [Dactylellina haptotyla CBS 200.50]